jgi:hypothetical protein
VQRMQRARGRIHIRGGILEVCQQLYRNHSTRNYVQDVLDVVGAQLTGFEMSRIFRQDREVKWPVLKLIKTVALP